MDLGVPCLEETLHLCMVKTMAFVHRIHWKKSQSTMYMCSFMPKKIEEH